MVVAPSAETLRDRKKRQTRERIAAVAARLFRTRGYEHVLMRDVANAAAVSEQTLYNYFPTKEHLVFDLDREFEERLIALVRDRPPGTTIAKAVERDARRFLDALVASIGQPTDIPPRVALGAALRRVWVEINARAADRVADALIDDAREPHTPAAAAIASRSIVAVFAVALEQVGVASLRGTSPRAIRRELAATIAAATSRGTLRLGSRPARRPHHYRRVRSKSD